MSDERTVVGRTSSPRRRESLAQGSVVLAPNLVRCWSVFWRSAGESLISRGVAGGSTALCRLRN